MIDVFLRRTVRACSTRATRFQTRPRACPTCRRRCREISPPSPRPPFWSASELSRPSFTKTRRSYLLPSGPSKRRPGRRADCSPNSAPAWQAPCWSHFRPDSFCFLGISVSPVFQRGLILVRVVRPSAVRSRFEKHQSGFTRRSIFEKTMIYLVTGGSRFIGKRLVRALLRRPEFPSSTSCYAIRRPTAWKSCMTIGLTAINTQSRSPGI